MFEIDNEKIGKYLDRLIETKFDSARDFCRAYLRLQNENLVEAEISNMSNRISQIKKGAKAVQIYDLPAFSQLLGVSFEQILSAGECGSTGIQQNTNYTIAQSSNEQDWIEYIKDGQNPFWHRDEYGKTVIDYAVGFGNYKLIKYLYDNEYIFFSDGMKTVGKSFVKTFGVNTKIKELGFDENAAKDFEKNLAFYDEFPHNIITQDQLRSRIISLAISNNDIKMLEDLKARETPEMYFGNINFYCGSYDIDSHYDKYMVKEISEANCKILKYFTDWFYVPDSVRHKNGKHSEHIFVFPYYSQLLDFLIANNKKFVVTALEKAIKHNEQAFDKLSELVVRFRGMNEVFAKNWHERFEFSENGDFVSFYNPLTGEGMITNVVNSSKKSSDMQVNILIEKLNDSYNKIKNITESKEFNS